jgi:hypothetical protein
MASGQDLLRYITARAIEYWETPKAERKKKRAPSEPWSYRWFGMMPLTVNMWMKRWKRRLKGLLR